MLNETIALIPARKGSTRVKDKNIRLLDGKPLISITIENALYWYHPGRNRATEVYHCHYTT